MTPTLKIALEIILLAMVYYGFIRHLQTTRGGGLLAGFIAVMLLTGAVFILLISQINLQHLDWIADKALPALSFAMLIIFQNELRMAIARIGNVRLMRIIQRFFGSAAPAQRLRMVKEIVNACDRMSKSRTGALIVIQRRQGIEGYVGGGQRMNAEVSARLLENIFYKGAPLHDGAVLITEGRIKYAACHLPSAAEETDTKQHLGPGMTRDLGTRHRAAFTVSEDSDALVVVVSEETGRISIAKDGALIGGVSTETLRDEINQSIVMQIEEPEVEASLEEKDDGEARGSNDEIEEDEPEESVGSSHPQAAEASK